MNIKILLSFLIIFFIYGVSNESTAQLDPQFTQFYANSLYLNPAFTGSKECSRAFMVGRLQWPGFQGAHTTGTVSFDNFSERYKSGLGAMVTQDYNPGSGFSSLDISGLYSYQINFTENITFRPGLQIGIGKRSIDYGKLDFNNQYTNREGVNLNINSGENFNNSSIIYPDVSAGGVVYSKNYWLGIAAHHLNTPKYNVVNGPVNNIAMKLGMHGGIKILLKKQARPRYGIIQGEKESSISPTFIYKMQGVSKQLDLGLYARHNQFVAGVWYRGLPIVNNGLSRQDAVNLLVGFIYEKFTIGYSYDITISKLGTQSGGAHELSLTYAWPPKGYPKRKFKRRNHMKKKRKPFSWPSL